MGEVERLHSEFVGISILEARVDSKLPDGVTLSFHLAPTPVPIQWKSMFSNLTGDRRGSVMSTSKPLIHGDNIIWKVVEGDIPNAKRLVEERVEQANTQFVQMLSDSTRAKALEGLAPTQGEIERLQQILDQA